MSLPWGIGLPMIKVYSDETQTVLQRTLYLPPVDKKETRLAWKKKAIRKELVDGGERQRVLAYTPVLTLKWKVYPDLNHRGLGFGQADGNMLTLPDLVEVLALGSGRLRVCPGLSKATRVATQQLSGTGDGITLAYQLQGIVDGRTVPARKFPSAPAIYRNGALLTAGADYALSSTGLVTLPATTNPVVSQNIGTGTGSLAAFTITTPNGSSPTVQNVWQTDWRGTCKMKTTARTNHCWPSTPAPSSPWTMDASGTGVVPTITANYSTAPDGTMTATRVQMDKGSGVGFARIQGYSATLASGKYCDSIYIKTNDGAFVSGVLRNNTDGQAISINGNWQRFSISNLTNTTTPSIQLLLWNTFGSSQTADLSVWGAQIESGDASQTIAPNHASISQSDYCAIATKDATKVRFVRPISDGQGFETCNPGARLARFITNSRYVAIKLAYTGLVTRVDTYNAISWVLVDGVPYRAFSKIQGIGSSMTVVVEVFFPTEGTRTIEVPAPYCASVDFVGVDLEASATISAASARPSTRLLVMGDSITHGFTTTELTKSWPYLLGGLKSWQVINMGYGSRRCYPSDATNMAGLNPSVATYLIGYNDFGGQVALATFKGDYTSFINNFRALYPSVKLYCITPLATQTVLAIPIESYRQQIRDALTTLANPLNVLIEGTTLTDSGWSSFNGDGIHPNDLGSAEIAAHLNSLVTP